MSSWQRVSLERPITICLLSREVPGVVMEPGRAPVALPQVCPLCQSLLRPASYPGHWTSISGGSWLAPWPGLLWAAPCHGPHSPGIPPPPTLSSPRPSGPGRSGFQLLPVSVPPSIIALCLSLYSVYCEQRLHWSLFKSFVVNSVFCQTKMACSTKYSASLSLWGFFFFFWMWIIFKVFVDFITTLLPFYVLVMLSSPTRDWTHPQLEGEVNHGTAREVFRLLLMRKPAWGWGDDADNPTPRTWTVSPLMKGLTFRGWTPRLM